jgi:4-amino-4-deoxy-L-arabinose transferase-like glycosyltransferase
LDESRFSDKLNARVGTLDDAEAIRARAEPQVSRRARTWGLTFPWQWGFLLLIVALAIATRFSTLAFQSLWLDEAFTLAESGQPWSELIRDLFDPHQAYPLYILGMRLWYSLFGTSEVALRLPSAIAGVCAVPALYLLGRRLFNWQTGMLAALLLALSPLAIWYSQEAKAYAFLLLLSVVTWLLLWRAIEQPSRGTWGVFATATLVALFTHRLAAVLSLIGQLIYVISMAYEGRFAARYRRLLVGLLVTILLVTIAGLWFVLGDTGASRQFSTQRSWTDLANTFTQFSLRIPPGPPEVGQGPDRRTWLLPFALIALAGGVSLALDLRIKQRRRRSVFALSFLLAPVVVFYLLYLIRPFYHERYLLGALPAYILLLAQGTSALWNAVRHLARSKGNWVSFEVGELVLAFALVLPLASWRQIQDWSLAYRPSKEQFREATRYLQEHAHPQDLIIVHPGYILPAVEYYQEQYERVPLNPYMLGDPTAEDYSFSDFEADMDDLSRGRRRAWLLIAPYHAETWDPNHWVSEWFTLNPFEHCDQQHFNGLDLYCVTFNELRRVGFPTPTLTLEASFAGSILLFGADLEPFQLPLEPGDTLPLTLYVVGQQADLPDLEAVLRLVDADGQVWTETAGRALGGLLPTSVWVPGDEFLDFHELLLPEKLPAGRYTVQAGYRPTEDASIMLPLPDGSFWVSLDTVDVAERGAGP